MVRRSPDYREKAPRTCSRGAGWSASGRLERVPDPLDVWLRGAEITHDEDVEPHRQPRELRALLEKLLGGARDALLFAPIDARRGAAPFPARPRTHLGNDQ